MAIRGFSAEYTAELVKQGWGDGPLDCLQNGNGEL